MAGGLLTEPLDPEKHDRASFSSGIEQVDNFLQRTANKLAQAGNLRAFVLPGTGADIVGFYAINAWASDYRNLPKRFARTRPSHGQIPVAFISMIGVDERHQGKGYGSLLLADALKRIVRVSHDLGVAAVMLDVLEHGDAEEIDRRKAFYIRHSYTALPDQPLRLFLPLAVIPMEATSH